MVFPTTPEAMVPHLDPVGDLGNFVYAVSQMPAGKAYMAAGTFCTWPEWIETWGRINNIPVKYRQCTVDEMIEATPDKDAGIETSLMFDYASDPGYGGGMELFTAKDIEKVCTRFIVTLMRCLLCAIGWHRVSHDYLGGMGEEVRLVSHSQPIEARLNSVLV